MVTFFFFAHSFARSRNCSWEMFIDELFQIGHSAEIAKQRTNAMDEAAAAWRGHRLNNKAKIHFKLIVTSAITLIAKFFFLSSPFLPTHIFHLQFSYQRKKKKKNDDEHWKCKQSVLFRMLANFVSEMRAGDGCVDMLHTKYSKQNDKRILFLVLLLPKWMRL